MSGYRVRNHIERVHTFLPMLIEHRLTIHGLFEIFDVAHIKGFRLAQYGPNKYPYGTRYAKRVFLPEDYDAGDIGEENKIHDYAIVELKNPLAGVLMTMPSVQVDWLKMWGTLYSVGYPGDLPFGSNHPSSGKYAYGSPGASTTRIVVASSFTFHSEATTARI